MGRRHSLVNNNDPYDWFHHVNIAMQSGRWEALREMLNLRVGGKNQSKQQRNNSINNNNNVESSPRRKVGFWRRITGNTNADDPEQALNADNSLFVHQDKGGRTLLHLALTHSSTPTDVVLLLMKIEPRAATIPNAKGRFPLHTAVWYGHHIDVVAELVEAHPSAIGAADGRGQTPLAYAMANAITNTDLDKAPSSFWMPAPPRDDDDDDNEEEHENHNQGGDSMEAVWQERAVERWAVVHWLLLASATYPQTSLTVGGQKPMLVEALVFAAPPAVVSLLIGASVVLLSYESRASAFAGTTLYTCIARQYPLSILVSLALQCPADVRSVSDETGMGLIAAQFVVGCFQRRNDATEEWALVEDVWTAIQETISEGALPEESIDPALCDWWAKVEFLIAFCSPNPKHAHAMSSSSKSEQRKYLLHQAAINSDVPPTVLRLLLALYPDSAMLPAPIELGNSKATALPLALVAQTPEYLPRNYELPIMTSENSLEIVLNAAPKAAWTRHKGRTPLHWAIVAGKTYKSLAALVDVDSDRMLRMRDSETNLYPFLLAAYIYGVNGLGRLLKEWKSQQQKPDDDESSSTTGDYDSPTRLYTRWTRVARNQYTHYVWKGLSERQKASAVYRVIQGRSIAGLSTIWQLLMHTPDLVPQTPFKRVPTNSARDERGVGTVANHFLQWCYPSGDRNASQDPTTFHERNWKSLREAIRTAPSGGLANLPTDFEKWFNKMRFWIRYCCPANPAVRRGNSKSLKVDPRWDCPSNDENFLLHMAVMNPDTPPPVVNLLLGSSPMSATMTIPNTQFLPLHLACRTPIYVSRFFEVPYDSCVRLLTRVYPEATKEFDDDGKLPLHRAIESRRPWADLELLVLAYPKSLVMRTPDSLLFPFQLMALPKISTRIQRLNRLYKARNRVDTDSWESYTPLQKVRAVRQEESQESLDILNSIFELFRRDVSMVAPSLENHQIEKDDAEEQLEETLSDNERCSTNSSESTWNVPGLNVTDHNTLYDLEPSEGHAEDGSASHPEVSDSHPEASDKVDGTDSQVDKSDSQDDCLTENDTIVSGLGTTNHTGISTWGDAKISEKRKESGSTGPTDIQGSDSSDSTLDNYLQGAGKDPSALMNFLSTHEKSQSQSKRNEQSVFDCDTSVLSNVDVLSTLSSTLHSTIHSNIQNQQGRAGQKGRRYSSAGKGFESEHGRVSEGGEESTGHGEVGGDGKNMDSESESSSSGSGSEFAGDSSAYLSFAISGSSGHLSFDEDYSGEEDASQGVDSEAASFAAAALQSEDVSENSETSSSSLVHFKLRRKQRVGYWEDRETLDPVRVSKQHLQLRTEDISSVYSTTSSDKISSAQQQSMISQNSDSMSSVSIGTEQKTSVDSSPMTKSVSMRSMKSTGVDSYASLGSKDLMQSSITDMVWMPEDLVKGGKLLGGQESSREFDESMLAELGYDAPASPSAASKLSTASKMGSHSKSNNSDSLESDTSGSCTTAHETFYGVYEETLLRQILPTKEDYDSDSSETSGDSSEGDEKLEESKTSVVDNLDEKSEEFRTPVGNSPGDETLDESKNSVGDGENLEDSKTSVASSSQTQSEAGTPQKSTDRLRRLLVPEELSESEFGPHPNLEDSENSEGSIGIHDVFKVDASQRSKASRTSARSQSKRTPSEIEDVQQSEPGSTMKSPSEKEETTGQLLDQVQWGEGQNDDADLQSDQDYGMNDPVLDSKAKNRHENEIGNSVVKSSPDTMEDQKSSVNQSKLEAREVVYFDRKEMRWKKKKVNEKSAAAVTAPPDSKPTSESPKERSKEQPQPQKKKEMYFDRKSMRWKVREATGENSARNLETNLTSIDENREASVHTLVPTRRGSQTGSPFVELATLPSKKGPSGKTNMEKKQITVQDHLGSIPERRSGGTPSLLASKNMLCLLCSKNRREVLLKPCQHLAICRVCSREYKEIAMCPLCEKAVTDRMLIF